MDDAAVVHHPHLVADLDRDAEILLDEQDRHPGRLDLPQALDQRADDRRREALGRLVDQQKLARLDDGAGDRQHLLLSARERARARQPEFLERRKEPEDPLEARVVERPLARAEHEVLLDREIGEHRHRLRRVADAESRDVARRERLERRVPERDAPLRGAPQPHDGAQRRRLAGAVAAEQHRRPAARRVEVDALQDVIAADVGVHALERQAGAHAAFPGAIPR